MRSSRRRTGTCSATFDPGAFEARLVAVDGSRVAQGRDFGSDGTLRDERRRSSSDEDRGTSPRERLEGAPFAVRSVDEKPYTPAARRAVPDVDAAAGGEPQAPLLRRRRRCALAQRLYENGYITYMRTDSVTLSETALAAARAQAARALRRRVPCPRSRARYERAVKNAQEAHEAIRPAGDTFRTPDAGRSASSSRDELALYDLIWKRTIASQMKDARGQTVSHPARRDDRRPATTPSSAPPGTVITFPGFLRAYESGRDEPADDDEERRLPQLEVGQARRRRPRSSRRATRRARRARYTEASLVKALEDRGIGRPSTYASIMGTILDRGYVFKKGTALVPTFLAFAVVQLLEQHFEQLVDYDFTARMEDDLDRIAAGDEERVEWLRRFYFGDDGDPGLHALVTEHLDEIDARAVNSIPIPGTRRRRARRPVRPVPRARRRSARASPTTSRPTS